MNANKNEKSKSSLVKPVSSQTANGGWKCMTDDARPAGVTCGEHKRCSQERPRRGQYSKYFADAGLHASKQRASNSHGVAMNMFKHANNEECARLQNYGVAKLPGSGADYNAYCAWCSHRQLSKDKVRR